MAANPGSKNPAIVLLLGTLASLALAYLVHAAFFAQSTPGDFRYVWRAGQLWAAGIDPYGPSFTDANEPGMTPDRAVLTWVYPPTWYLLATPFALLPQPVAFVMFKAGAMVALLGLGWKATAAIARDKPASPTYCLAVLAYAASMSATGGALRSGQPSVVCAIGIIVVAIATFQRRHWLLVAGLVLTMMKPTTAFPFIIACLLVGSTRRSAVTAIGVSAVIALPAVAISGWGQSFITAFRASTGQYATVSFNLPDSMTGALHLPARLFDFDASLVVSVLLAGLITAVIVVTTSKAVQRGSASEAELLVIAPMVGTLGFAMMHVYDLAWAVVLLPLIARLDRVAKGIALAGFAALWRPENVARIFSGTDDPVYVADVATAGVLCLAVAFTIYLARMTAATSPPASHTSR